jgi:lipopolysaccharide biosynthesis regulator YciM
MEEPYLFLAEMHIARKEFDKANQVLQNAQAFVSARESILLKKVRAYRGLKDIDGVERHLRELLKINESNLEAMRMLEDVFVGRRQWAEALDVERKIRKQVKTADENQRLIGLQYERAKELLEKGDERLYEGILKDIREITEENKRFIPAYILAADVYRKMGRLNDAGRVYGRGFSKTGHVIFLQKMEDLYVQRGEPGVILKIYRRLLEVAPKNQFLIFLYARLCLKLEMIDEAIEILNSLMAEEKEFQGLHRAMAEAYVHRGEHDAASREFGKAFPITKAYVPFYCANCQSVKEEWTDFCENCYSWNTVNIRQEGLFQQEADHLRLLYEHE